MKKYLYLSHILGGETPAYGGGEGLKTTSVKSISGGDSCNMRKWEMPNHIGTHIDFPNHFFDSGATVEDYPASFWVCDKVYFIDLPLDRSRWIGPDDLRGKAGLEADCILLKTGFQKFRGKEEYFRDNPGLSAELADFLRMGYPNLKFIGVDFISISRFADREGGRKAHRHFLDPAKPGKSVLPIEDMDLAAFDQKYRVKVLSVFPLRVEMADGAPVTVVAELE